MPEGDTIFRAARTLHRAKTFPGAHDVIRGVELVNKVIRVDQQPIGQTPTSNPSRQSPMNRASPGRMSTEYSQTLKSGARTGNSRVALISVSSRSSNSSLSNRRFIAGHGTSSTDTARSSGTQSAVQQRSL